MTALYVPPTDEADHKKQNQSLQLIGGVTSTNTTNIAANTASIVTNTASITANNTAITNLQTAGTGLTNVAGSLAVSLSKITASLGADVVTNVVGTYFTGPSIAQGTSGTWWVSGTVTVLDTAGASTFWAKLWDGTTVIDSAVVTTQGANGASAIALSGFIASPAGNLKISVREPNLTTGKIIFNSSGESKDSTISAIRIA